MQFYTIEATKTPKAPRGATYPCILLIKVTWDDYGHKTLHRLYYQSDKNTDPAELGSSKFLQEGAYETNLPAKFTELPDSIVSLGEDIGFYETALELLQEDTRPTLEALNDVVTMPRLLESVETKTGFRNSLIRFNDAKIALRDGAAILDNRKVATRDFKFHYQGSIPGAESDVDTYFDLSAKDVLPGRIAAIIGRNGVGKTQFLAQLAKDLATPQRISKEKLKSVESKFQPQKPLFSRVIALSFSAFDRFTRPEQQNFSYIYCGVRDDSKGVAKTLELKHLEFLHRIQEQQRGHFWSQFVGRVMDRPAREFRLIEEIAAQEAGEASPLSSGQSILIYFISAALAYLKEDALILFDEPEIHLHPNAIATLIAILQELLLEFDAYAIIATHSPLVIQEVPSARVLQFERQGKHTSSSQLSTESFGENISELTRYVFETVEISNFYKQTLRDLAETNTFDEVLDIFDNRLSLHAMAFLSSLYAKAGNA